ncbi:hypothetical protein BT96DRAFT_869095, partial [Gymnopus androsaceus JB14]
MLSWLNAVTAGTTRKDTVNVIMLRTYCIGNAAGPFMWKQKYKPRNHVSWTIIEACYVSCMALLLLLPLYMSRENLRRDAEPRDDSIDDNVYVERETIEAKIQRVKVVKGVLNMTNSGIEIS